MHNVRKDIAKHEWVTVKLPRDLLDVVDSFILKPRHGIRIYDSRPSFIRAICYDYLQKHGMNVGKISQEEELLA
jgi:metal-responsive CopG/Arc/MetJ family transcriptional regulator